MLCCTDVVGSHSVWYNILGLGDTRYHSRQNGEIESILLKRSFSNGGRIGSEQLFDVKISSTES
jgi:hypothetical protein